AVRPAPNRCTTNAGNVLLSASEMVASTLAPGLVERAGFNTANGGNVAKRVRSSASVSRNRVQGCNHPSRVRFNFHSEGNFAFAGWSRYTGNIEPMAVPA